MSHTCSEFQVVIVNLLYIKHKIRLLFTDILPRAAGLQEQKALCKVTGITKRSSQVKGQIS